MRDKGSCFSNFSKLSAKELLFQSENVHKLLIDARYDINTLKITEDYLYKRGLNKNNSLMRLMKVIKYYELVYWIKQNKPDIEMMDKVTLQKSCKEHNKNYIIVKKMVKLLHEKDIIRADFIYYY